MSKLNVIKNDIPKALRALRPRALVVHELRLLYYPIPKAASTGILRHFLEHAFMKEQIIPEDLTANNIHGYYDYPFVSFSEALKLQKQGYRSFGVKRDPAKRLASCYRDKILEFKSTNMPLRSGFERYNKLLGKRIFSTDMTYENFVLTVSRIPDFLSDEHFRSQYKFLPCQNGKILLDRLISLEKFDVEAEEMCQAFGIPRFKRSRANATTEADKPGSVSHCDTDPIARVIKKRYRRDYSLFGY